MDQTQAVAIPADSSELAQIIRAYGARKVIEALRDHCYSEAQWCKQDGLTGLGWLELYDTLEESVPVSDDALCGDVAAEVVVCRACRTGGEHCTC